MRFVLLLVLALQVASAVHAQQGDLLLDDLFDDPGGWPVVHDADVAAQVEGGVYRIEAHVASDAPRWVTRPGLVDPSRVQYVEVDVRVTEGEGGGLFGLTWGGDAGRYVVYVTGGHVGYERFHPVKPDGLPLQPASAWQPGDWNRVGVLRLPTEGQGDRVYVWINGQPSLALLTSRLAGYAGRPAGDEVGFLVAGDVVAEVDAVLVRAMDPGSAPAVPSFPEVLDEQADSRWVAQLPPSDAAPGGANLFLWLQRHAGSLGASVNTIAADGAGAEWQADFVSGTWSVSLLSQTVTQVCLTFRPEEGGRSCYLYRSEQTAGAADAVACEGYAGDLFDTTFTPGINCRRYRSDGGGEALWSGEQPFWRRAEVIPGR